MRHDLKTLTAVLLVATFARGAQAQAGAAMRADTASRATFKLAALTEQADSFVVLANGNPIGTQVSALQRNAGGWTWTETTAIPMVGVQQTTTLTFSAELSMQALHQVGAQRGQQSKIDIDYAGGRAKGQAMVPSPSGPKTIDVDAEMPRGAIDDNALQALMAVMPWARDAKVPVAVFQSGKGALVNVSLNVVGEEQVTVPAGTFDAWKVELVGGEAPLAFYVAKGMPAKVVRIVPIGSPLSIDRAR